MLRIFLWGTGNIAEMLWMQCQTLSQYELLGFIDNNTEKQGAYFKGLYIYSPEVLDKCRPDYIVILTDAYDEIYKQIVDAHPEMENIIENKYFFYKESILKRYKATTNPEEIEVLNYIKRNGLNIFNYEFSEKYRNIKVEVCLDTTNNLYYVMHLGKRLYFSRDLNNEKKVIDYYKSILLEQDIRSPHRYLVKDFDINREDVVVDVGVAEGNFSLEIIDKVSKIYLIEVNKNWIEALKETFKDYLDKVVIIQKFVSSYNDDNFATLDALIHEPVNFIKMDIEGNEWDALQGAEGLIRSSNNLKCAICSYHSDFDQVLIEDFMDKNNLVHTTSPGFMWFPWTIRQNYVSTKLNRAVVRGIKCSN